MNSRFFALLCVVSLTSSHFFYASNKWLFGAGALAVVAYNNKLPFYGRKVNERIEKALNEGDATTAKTWFQLLTTSGHDYQVYFDAATKRACATGYTDILKVVIENGGSVNTVDHPPLVRVAEYTSDKGYQFSGEVAKFLLAHKARLDVRHMGGTGHDPLKQAVKYNNVDVVAVLADQAPDLKDRHELAATIQNKLSLPAMAAAAQKMRDCLASKGLKFS